MKKLFLISLSILFVALVGCEKERLEESSSAPLLRLEEGKSKDIDISQLTEAEDVKVKVTHLLAESIVHYPFLKKHIFSAVVNISEGKEKEVFFLDLINRRYEGNTLGNYMKSTDALPRGAYDELVYQIATSYPDLVVDVPTYIGWFVNHIDTRDDFLANYESLPFVFFPEVRKTNRNGKYVGYGEIKDKGEGHRNSEIAIHEIGSRDYYDQIIPFFVKKAETTIVLRQDGKTLDGGTIIDKYYGDIVENGKDCVEKQVENLKQKVILGEDVYEIVKLDDLIQTTKDCDRNPPVPPRTDEICDNGIDDDGDGRIDCADPDCCGSASCGYNPTVCSEICDNGIDDDGDGYIDEADIDCQCNCFRDCNDDSNSLVKHTFENVSHYYHVTNEFLPGIEKDCNLRFDVTTPCVGCPDGFHAHKKYVIRRMLALSCSPSQVGPAHAHLCTITDYGDYDAFFYGAVYNIAHQNMNASNGILFGTAANSTAEIMSPYFWVFEEMPYLQGDWDASRYADQIRISVHELDNETITTDGTTTTMQSRTISHNYIAKIGLAVGIPIGDESSVSYTFNNAETIAVTTGEQIKVTAENIADLGDFDLFYCQEENEGPFSTNASWINFAGKYRSETASFLHHWDDIDNEQ